MRSISSPPARGSETPVGFVPRTANGFRAVLHSIAVLALLITFFLLSARASLRKAPTFDEPTHLAMGWSYLRTGSYRLSYEHPPLIEKIAALPLLTMELGEPEDYPGWERGYRSTFGHFFLYEGNDFETMFRRAHLTLALLGALMGLWLYLWSRDLWGGDGAFLSLALFAFSPNLLAHAPIVSTDYAFASFGLLSLWAWFRWLARPSIAGTALVGIASGLTLLTKFTAVMFVPIWLGWWIWAAKTRGRWPAEMMKGALASSETRSRWSERNLGFWSAQLVILVVVVALVVLAGYGFHPGAIAAGVRTFFDHSKAGHPAYLLGEVSTSGWWHYFLVAYLVKTPLPELILMVLGMACWSRDRRARGAWLLLAAPWIYILVVTSLGRVNIGYRHILPMVPLAMVMAGSVFAISGNVVNITQRTRRLFRWMVLAVIAWQVSIGVRAFPDYLAYFNEAAGGSRNSPRWLSDSNVDWGQDLTTLSEWMGEYDVPIVYLAYFGTAEVASYGVSYWRLPGYNNLRGPMARFDPRKPDPGTYAIFGSNLTGQFLSDPDLYAWFREREPDAILGGSVYIYRVN